jgi:uncharacterized protein (DUF1697 family)
MARYAAFLRGISPTNAKMPELRACFEAAGFADVKTVLSSGNVVFDAAGKSPSALERKAEAEMEKKLGRSFLTIVRPVEELRSLLARDPYSSFRVSPKAKRVVTFLRRRPKAELDLPLEVDGARILCIVGHEAFLAYVPSPRGAIFMRLIEKTFGPENTTRTWDTIAKVSRA